MVTMFKLGISWILDFFKSSTVKWILIGVIILIAIISFSNIAEIFGYESRAVLKEKVAIEKSEKEKVVDANHSLQGSLDYSNKSGDLGLKIVENFYLDKNESKEFYSDTIRKMEEEIAKLESSDEVDEPEEVIPEVKDTTPNVIPKPITTVNKSTTTKKKVATVQIDAIWSAYDKVISNKKGVRK